GLKNVKNILDDIRKGKSNIDFLEVRACPDACVEGGGQPLLCNEKQIRARIKTIYDIDDKETICTAGDNEKLKEIYNNYFNKDKKNKNILYTSYSEREVLK
ncbi:MAG: [Fe-Fe] hydrogenase large subunit C-terminal domain-containing protein, partial [Bacteroidota bacterium]|nr:[Fe-Fe] hydrogenase large subunit C-terminal domain-containing protein [Bacteroidota bacterium]